ncbi:hypothetical protein HDU78_006046 [Chytriomyces hyalinus]|nr:hypothetical protein HDU78_006046 [Chytriomyces hyalinus]
MGIFALGLSLGLALSHRHLQQEVTSFKQGKACPTSNDAVMDSVTRERDNWHALAMTLKRVADLETRVDVLQAEKRSRANSACRACQLSTHAALPAGASDSVSRGPAVIRPMPPSATPQPVAQPATATKLTPSFVHIPTDTTPTDTTTPIVAITTPVVNTTPQPIHQVALAAKARFGLINRPASAVSAHSANTLPSPAFIATPATKSNTPLSTTAQPTSQPAATAPITPSVTHTPTHKSNATPTDATIPIATTSTPATNTTPHTVPQVALAAEARFGLINRPASAAGAQSATTTQSPPTLTATPASTSTTSITNINSAAGATRALIKRAPAAISPSTHSRLPRPVTTTTTTTTSNTTPTATTPTSKSTYTPDKATLAAAAILGLISRGSAGKGPFTPTKLAKLDRTPTATPSRTIMHCSPSKIPLPSPDVQERAFFAEEKYFAKLPFPKVLRPPPVCRPCDDVALRAYAKVVQELKAQLKGSKSHPL